MGGDQSKKQPSSEDYSYPVRQSGLINNQVYERGKCIIEHIHKRQWNQINQYFHKRQIKVQSYEAGGSSTVCLRQTKKEEIAYECITCQYIEGKYYCSDCFQKDAHKNHNYRQVDGKRVVCECGNDQIMDQAYFCNKHNKNVPILPKQNAQFQNQAKIFLQLLLFVKEESKISETSKLWPESMQFFGEPLLNWLIQVANSPHGKVTVAQALLNKMQMLKNSQIDNQTIGKTLLQGLIVSFYKHGTIAGLLVGLINQLFWTGPISKELLRIHYKVMLLGTNFDVIPDLLQILNNDYTICYKNQVEYFSDKSNVRIFLNHPIAPNRLQIEYSTYFDSLQRLLKFNQCSKMIANILRETPFSKMFNFHFPGTAYSQSIAKLALPAFYLARGIVKVVDDKVLLKSIIFNMLQSIQKKEYYSIDFIFQRSFALALFQYFDFALPNASQLKQFFSEGKVNARQLILRFWQAKNSQLETYNEQVLKNASGKGCPSLTVLCTDQLYLKILSSLITSKQEVTSLYRNFGERVHGSAVEGLQPIKAKIVNNGVLILRIQQIATFISVLSASLNSNIPEIVLRGCQKDDKQSTDDLLSFLAAIFQGTNAADFKYNAQRFVQEEHVVTFIKEKLLLEGKKIRCKNEIKHKVGTLPFSDYFSSGLPEITIDRMMACKWQGDREHRNMFIDQECLRHLMVILYACLIYLQDNRALDEQVQQELEMVLRSVLAFSAEKKNKEFIGLVHRIHSRITSCPNDLDSFARRVIDSEKVEDNARNNKKKQKMLELKAKQKNMLQALQVQEELVGLSAQCIICKNSKPRNPSLLGHFGYKNIFAGVLKADTPFLQFSTCGHYIHEECLQQTHKNQFKVWYPCILCKSISNILLPNVKTASQEQDSQLLERVLTFLKNLGGIYTFFYQDRKQLLQFTLENVEGVFPLLFKTLAYQITFYPLINLAYFQRSQLPVTRFLFDLLQFTSDRLKGVPVIQKVEVAGQPFFVSLYTYVAEQLGSVLKHKGHRGAGSSLPFDVIVVVQEIIYMLSKQDEKMEISQKDTKIYRQSVVATFKHPPLDLRQLQFQPIICASCQKQVYNYEMCMLCEWACCVKCSEVKKVHALQSHLSEGVFIRNANGKCSYVHQELLAELPSLYADYLGQEYTKTERAAAGEYRLSLSRWDNVVEDLLNNRIHREIMKHQ